MHVRFAGILALFALVVAVAALRPGGADNAAALLATVTDTPVPTNTPVPTDTPVPTSTPTTVPATPTATATPQPATVPLLNFPTSQCVGSFPFPSSANVTFSWTGPQNVSEVHLDLTQFDNNFQTGTFATAVLSPGTTSFTWLGLTPGQAYQFRVVGVGLDGNNVSSDIVRFTPCGTQRLLILAYVCTGGGRATVTFRWAPTSSPALLQYLDLTLFNNNFAPGTFLGAGAMPPSQQDLIWPGILANVQHFFRVNELTVFGWGPSQTGTFIAFCP
jgi:hypothetical protein